jgi:hypothetical protein
MKFPYLEISIMASAVLGATTPIRTPDRWVRYDLEVPVDLANNTTNLTLAKRTNVGICESKRASGSPCSYLGHIYDTVNFIGARIKDQANQKSCGTVSGSVNDVSYKYYAAGQNCDTTAEQQTIAGAIEHHLKYKNNGQLCDTECLDLTHSGSWNGHLLIGLSGSFASNAYCGPSLSFDNCDNGGKADFQ